MVGMKESKYISEWVWEILREKKKVRERGRELVSKRKRERIKEEVRKLVRDRERERKWKEVRKW